MKNPIKFFSAISAADINEVGGKGANLGELVAAGFNVPDGFCITTAAYNAFIEPEHKRIFALLGALDANDLAALRQTGKKVRGLLDELSLPQQLHQPLKIVWQKTGEANAYAVRSSATAEDLPHASFAGQQDTFLNVIGWPELLQAIKDCFISLFTDRAILYRVQNRFSHADVALSVVVQKMILPKVSGIMFTADPVSGRRGLVSIDASFGLGEALVSGVVSADHFQVEKATGTIVRHHIGDKKIAILPVDGGGTQSIDLDDDKRASATLNNAGIVELAKIGAEIEQHYGKPQDIEWAFVDGEFHITQSRPITSLFPLPTGQLAADKLYLSLSHLQVMTDAMRPLSMALFTAIIPIARDQETLQSRYVFPVGGRLYAEISNVLSHPIAGRVMPKMVRRADQLISRMVIDWQKRDARAKAKSNISLRKLLPIIVPVIWKVRSCLFWRKYDNFPIQISDYIDRHIEQTQIKIDDAKSTGAQLEGCHRGLRDLIHTIEPWRAHLVASLLAIKLLDSVMRKRAETAHLDALMRGLEGNVTTEMDLAVGDLADAARASTALSDHLVDDSIELQARLQQAKKLPGGDAFIAKWEEFLTLYGARGPSEIDLYRPRWREDANSLMVMVAGMLKSGEKGSHRAHYQKLITQNALASKAIVEAAGGGLFGFIRKPLVRRLVYVIRELFPLREHHKFLIIKMLDLAKPVIERAAGHLQAEGQIKNLDDVWFMSLHELQACFGDQNSVDQAEIARRIEDFAHYRQLNPPRVMTGEGEVLSATYDTGNVPDGALVGSPVSAGIVEGTARVVLDPSQDMLHPGEILIAPFTDPGWTPLFVNAGGLVTEVGGLMTHGSVIAREYGIPAVVGVKDATKIISSGQNIRVHGEGGFIEFLDSSEE